MADGMASLTHGGKTKWFRTNPNSINWSYNLVTHVDETYGGRVIQILAVNMDQLTVTAHAGNGGWAYLQEMVLFLRDMLVNQRDSTEPGIFEYPKRGWKFAVYALSMPLSDSVDEVAREFTMSFKIQEDVSGVARSNTIDKELARLKEGIGYVKNEYNYIAAEATADNAAPASTEVPGTNSTGTGPGQSTNVPLPGNTTGVQAPPRTNVPRPFGF